MYVEQLLLRCVLAKAHCLRKCILYVSAVAYVAMIWRKGQRRSGLTAYYGYLLSNHAQFCVFICS